MTWHTIIRDGARLTCVDTGDGAPVIFQHGLGGDEAQVRDIFPGTAAYRRLTLECRGHGSSALGEPARLSIATFASDVLAFADQRGHSRFSLGGISMGAAIALRIAVTAPERVSALILSRPAWLWAAAPASMQVFAEIAALLRAHDPQTALAAFERSPSAANFAANAPDNLASLRRFFARPDPAATAALVAAIAADGPGIEEEEVKSLKVPTLVIGTTQDVIHPLAMAETLASRIPGATFARIAAKSADPVQHGVDFRAAVTAFLAKSLASEGPPEP